MSWYFDDYYRHPNLRLIQKWYVRREILYVIRIVVGEYEITYFIFDLWPHWVKAILHMVYGLGNNSPLRSSKPKFALSV